MRSKQPCRSWSSRSHSLTPAQLTSNRVAGFGVRLPSFPVRAYLPFASNDNMPGGMTETTLGAVREGRACNGFHVALDHDLSLERRGASSDRHKQEYATSAVGGGNVRSPHRRLSNSTSDYKLTPLILIRPEYAQPQRRKDFRNTSYLRCYRLVHPWNPW